MDNILIIRKFIKRAFIIIVSIIAVIVCVRLLNDRYKKITQTTYDNRDYKNIIEEEEDDDDDDNNEYNSIP